jgi:hypothetical protein
MMGAESGDMGRDSGIIPRFSFSLFERLAKSHNTSVEVSYFEIYNEKIRDLLSEDIVPLKTPLRVREHPQLGPYVEGLAVHSVASFQSLQVRGAYSYIGCYSALYNLTITQCFYIL